MGGVSFITDRRIGKVHIDTSLLASNNIKAIKAIVGEGVVLEAGMGPPFDNLVYTMWHPEFERVAYGALVPTYHVELRHHRDGAISVRGYRKA